MEFDSDLILSHIIQMSSFYLLKLKTCLTLTCVLSFLPETKKSPLKHTWNQPPNKTMQHVPMNLIINLYYVLTFNNHKVLII